MTESQMLFLVADFLQEVVKRPVRMQYLDDPFGPLSSGCVLRWPYRVLPIKFFLENRQDGIALRLFGNFKGVESQDVMPLLDTLSDSGKPSSDKDSMPI